MNQKVGRNDPCPCGSKKKYKKCCINTSSKQSMPQIFYHYSDEGTTDPFTARMMVQMMQIRDQIFQTKEERDSFDDIYEPILQNLREARLAKTKYVDLITSHEERIGSGECVEKDANGNFRITESVDLEANLLYKDIFIRGRTALDNLVAAGKHLGINLGFIYDSEKKFEEGIRKIAGAGGNPDYLRFVCGMVSEARGGWLEKLIDVRNQIEHEGFSLPKLQCDISSGKPKLSVHKAKLDDEDQDLRESVENFWNALFQFCELLLIFLLTTKLPKGKAIMLVPPKSRDPSCPVAFSVVPEPKTDQEGEKTWEEFKKNAEKAKADSKEASCRIRIKDKTGEQIALLELYENKELSTVIAIRSIPLEMIVLFMRGKDDAAKVQGRPDTLQTVTMMDFSKEEFMTWADRIAEVSRNTMLGEIVDDNVDEATKESEKEVQASK